MDKDLKALIKAVQAEGYAVRTTRKGHVVIMRDGKRVAALRRDGYSGPTPR